MERLPIYYLILNKLMLSLKLGVLGQVKINRQSKNPSLLYYWFTMYLLGCKVLRA